MAPAATDQSPNPAALCAPSVAHRAAAHPRPDTDRLAALEHRLAALEHRLDRIDHALGVLIAHAEKAETALAGAGEVVDRLANSGGLIGRLIGTARAAADPPRSPSGL